MASSSTNARRRFLFTGANVAGGVLLAGSLTAAEAAKGKKEEEISPAEDLMREHGALSRILLVYEECRRRLHAKANWDATALAESAKIVRQFVENYHEKLEEDHLFPRFQKAGKLVTLVKTLREQHDAGRKLTGLVLEGATPAVVQDAAGAKKLSKALTEFVRMYRPHKAREDTVLFPAFRQLMPEKEYDALGDQFEEKEHQLFGEDGFERNVAKIAEIEKRLGIHDLDAFTPKAT